MAYANCMKTTLSQNETQMRHKTMKGRFENCSVTLTRGPFYCSVTLSRGPFYTPYKPGGGGGSATKGKVDISNTQSFIKKNFIWKKTTSVTDRKKIFANTLNSKGLTSISTDSKNQ